MIFGEMFSLDKMNRMCTIINSTHKSPPFIYLSEFRYEVWRKITTFFLYVYVFDIYNLVARKKVRLRLPACAYACECKTYITRYVTTHKSNNNLKYSKHEKKNQKTATYI